MTGTSEERPFSLPFELGDGGPVPTRLEVNLVTEGSGQFWVGPLTIGPTSAEPATTVTTAIEAVSNGEGAEAEATGLWWGLGALLLVGVATFAGVAAFHPQKTCRGGTSDERHGLPQVLTWLWLESTNAARIG